MKISGAIARELRFSVAAFLLLVVAGIALVWAARHGLAQEHRKLGAAQAERRQTAERLTRLAHEEREARDHVELYQTLKELRIVGPERRLDWVETLARIRTERDLADVRYQVERQKLLKTLTGNPALALLSSSMSVELALLHEGDLLRFLADLRASGNAYYSVRQCAITRLAELLPAQSSAPRLRGACQIDLITLAESNGGT